MTQAIEKENFELDLRFAHIDGHTELDFVPDKKYANIFKNSN